MWNALDLVRVYTKPKGRMPDYETPVVLKRGRNTVENFCDAIHKSGLSHRFVIDGSQADPSLLASSASLSSYRSIKQDFKSALVFGTSVKHSRGQHVGLDHVLADEDLITIVRPVLLSSHCSTPPADRAPSDLLNSTSDRRHDFDDMYFVIYALCNSLDRLLSHPQTFVKSFLLDHELFMRSFLGNFALVKNDNMI
jgi:hypothetical protein